MSRKEYFGQPSDPKSQTCQWCEEQASRAYELYRPRKKIGTAQYIYACPRHQHVAQEASRAPRAAA